MFGEFVAMKYGRDARRVRSIEGGSLKERLRARRRLGRLGLVVVSYVVANFDQIAIGISEINRENGTASARSRNRTFDNRNAVGCEF